VFRCFHEEDVKRSYLHENRKTNRTPPATQPREVLPLIRCLHTDYSPGRPTLRVTIPPCHLPLLNIAPNELLQLCGAEALAIKKPMAMLFPNVPHCVHYLLHLLCYIRMLRVDHAAPPGLENLVPATRRKLQGDAEPGLKAIPHRY
jgi:hypothetical protein